MTVDFNASIYFIIGHEFPAVNIPLFHYWLLSVVIWLYEVRNVGASPWGPRSRDAHSNECFKIKLFVQNEK